MPIKLNVCNLPATYSAMKPKLANATKKQIDFWMKFKFFHVIYISFFNIQEEWPLGNDFFPSFIATGFPLHLKSGFVCPSGKHLQKKSGLGRPSKDIS